MTANTTGDLGNILGVWAHPDDEAYLSAGLMASAVAAGRRVVCVTATKGEAGFPEDDPRTVDELVALRIAELAACLDILKVTEHRFLTYADGECAEVDDDEAAAQVAEMITEIRPDTVLTFNPTGMTGHPDHIAACRWTTLAVRRVGVPVRLLYATKTQSWVERFMGDHTGVLMVDDFVPETVDESELAVAFSCDDALLERKVAALRAQASQTEAWRAEVGPDVYRELVREEFYREPRPTDRAVTLPGARR